MMNNQYLQRMKEMLQDEYDAYLSCIEQDPQRGFRINLLKTNEEDFFRIVNIDAQKSPYASNGYFTNAGAGIGYTPAYLAGLFYMQEPSASSAVTILDPKPGMKVLDLCAAPGSKSTQILEYLGQDGLLISNEIDAKRCQILSKNIEHHGAENAVVISADTKDVADAYENFFDAVLCDAPCSGEGMFRKSDDAIIDWSESNVIMCAARQRMILQNAYRCLIEGGVLVYSTCTFSKEENEENVAWLIQEYPDLEVEEINVNFGRPGFDCGYGTQHSRRIFPMDGGEGHFICRIRKNGTGTSKEPKQSKSGTIPKKVLDQLDAILTEQYPYMYLYQNHVYAGKQPFYECGKCRMVRNQIYLGDIEKNDLFEPNHAMAIACDYRFQRQVELDDDSLKKYLHGEQLSIPVEKGYCVLTWHGHGMGLGKSDGKVIKNKYPKGLRTR